MKFRHTYTHIKNKGISKDRSPELECSVLPCPPMSKIAVGMQISNFIVIHNQI